MFLVFSQSPTTMTDWIRYALAFPSLYNLLLPLSIYIHATANLYRSQSGCRFSTNAAIPSCRGRVGEGEYRVRF